MEQELSMCSLGLPGIQFVVCLSSLSAGIKSVHCCTQLGPNEMNRQFSKDEIEVHNEYVRIWNITGTREKQIKSALIFTTWSYSKSDRG